MTNRVSTGWQVSIVPVSLLSHIFEIIHTIGPFSWIHTQDGHHEPFPQKESLCGGCETGHWYVWPQMISSGILRLIVHTAIRLWISQSVDICHQIKAASEEWSQLKCRNQVEKTLSSAAARHLNLFFIQHPPTMEYSPEVTQARRSIVPLWQWTGCFDGGISTDNSYRWMQGSSEITPYSPLPGGGRGDLKGW